MKLLIIGVGSIGERHTRVFRRLPDVSVSILDERSRRVKEIAGRYGCAAWFTSLEDAPLDEFDAAVVATPADSHVPVGRICAQAGIHLLLEKPLAASLSGTRGLINLCRKKNLTLAVGYVLRFHPAVIRMRELCKQNLLGRLLSVTCRCTHYLPRSRPDYRDIYYAVATGGGGVILDLSHELNYLEWLLGPLRLEACQLATVRELGIPGEAIANFQLRSEDGIPVTIHLHAADRTSVRRCHIAGTNASLEADLISGEVLVQESLDRAQRFKHPVDRDQWHLDQAVDFIRALSAGTQPRCTGEEAALTLRTCLQAIRMGNQS